MPKEKFKLSETLRRLGRTINKITGGGELDLQISLPAQVIPPGSELGANITLRCPDNAHTVDYIAIGLRGSVQRDGAWHDYTETVEVAQQVTVEEGHELIIPLILYIPEDAVLSADGGKWFIEARVVLDRMIDPRARAEFAVEADAPPFEPHPLEVMAGQESE